MSENPVSCTHADIVGCLPSEDLPQGDTLHIAPSQYPPVFLRHAERFSLRFDITDEEFLRQRQELERERFRLEQAKQSWPNQNWFEPARMFLLFSVHAAKWFLKGNDEQKRLILEIAGSNPVLRKRNLKIDAKKPVRRWSDPFSISELCAGEESNLHALRHRNLNPACIPFHHPRDMSE